MKACSRTLILLEDIKLPCVKMPWIYSICTNKGLMVVLATRCTVSGLKLANQRTYYFLLSFSRLGQGFFGEVNVATLDAKASLSVSSLESWVSFNPIVLPNKSEILTSGAVSIAKQLMAMDRYSHWYIEFGCVKSRKPVRSIYYEHIWRWQTEAKLQVPVNNSNFITPYWDTQVKMKVCNHTSQASQYLIMCKKMI